MNNLSFPIVSNEDDVIWERIEKLMNEEVFKSKDLTLHFFTRMVLTNKIYLNRCLLNKTGMTFSKYLMTVRMDYVQKQIIKAKENNEIIPSIQLLFESAGYASYSTGLRHYKKTFGTLPSALFKR